MKSSLRLVLLPVLVLVVGLSTACAVSAQNHNPEVTSSSTPLLLADKSETAGTSNDTTGDAEGSNPEGNYTEGNGAQQTSEAERTKLNDLANLEASFHIIANGSQILGIMAFLPTLVLGIAGAIIGGKHRWIGFVIIGFAFFFLIGGLAAPGLINWGVGLARDAHMFD